MKKHQHDFLQHHGSSEQLHKLMDVNASAPTSLNPSYNKTHFLRQVKQRVPFLTHNTSQMNLTPSEVHTLLDEDQLNPASNSPAFGDEHINRLLDEGKFKWLQSEGILKASLTPHQTKKIFEDDEEEFGRPLYQTPHRNIFSGLAWNKNLSKEHFNKLWDFHTDDDHRRVLVDAHPDKVERRHVDEIKNHHESYHYTKYALRNKVPGVLSSTELNSREGFSK